MHHLRQLVVQAPLKLIKAVVELYNTQFHATFTVGFQACILFIIDVARCQWRIGKVEHDSLSRGQESVNLLLGTALGHAGRTTETSPKNTDKYVAVVYDLVVQNCLR